MYTGTQKRRKFMFYSFQAATGLATGMISCRPGYSATAAGASKFIGDIDLHEIEENGTIFFELIKDFGYLDPNGSRWQAKAGLRTDGATIPSVFWPITGHPLQGLYLKAAIIHDYYCLPQNRYREWEKVHRVFYDAMITNGVHPVKATLMFYAVWRFGPRWKVAEIKPCIEGPGNFCAAIEPSEYRVTTSAVQSFSDSFELDKMKQLQTDINLGRVSLESVPAVEAALPSLPRVDTVHSVTARSAGGWWFGHPYDFPFIPPK